MQDSIDEFFLLHTGNLADDNRHGEEPDAAFGKVPLTKRQASQKRAPCGAEVIARGANIKQADSKRLPRNKADDHDDKCKGEENKNALLNLGKLDVHVFGGIALFVAVETLMTKMMPEISAMVNITRPMPIMSPWS